MASNWKTRVDAKKNQWKVAKAILEKPLATYMEIAKETWLGKSTVWEHVRQLPKSEKDVRIINITETDLENVILWQNELQRRLQEWADKLKTQEIVQIMSEWTARYTKFRWDVTNPDGWERRHLDEKQLKAIDSILSYLSPNE